MSPPLDPIDTSSKETNSSFPFRCSMFRLLLRCAGQYIYLSPKDETFPFLMPASRMHVLLVVIPNIICMFLHLFTSLPVGPEYHRGYQHGGLIIDFIGQKPSTSRIYYLMADLFIMALQCFMLTIHTERERLRIALKTFKPALPELVQQLTNGRTIEDLDAEERGIAREQSDLALNEPEDVEMQPLNPNGEVGGDAETNSREASGDDEPRTHLSDIMNSGNAVLGDYHILHTLRRAATDLERTAAHSLRTISYTATLAALRARRRGEHVNITGGPAV